MPTLILTPRQTPDSRALWKAASQMGWQTERLGSWRIPEHVRSASEPVLYAEALFGPDLAADLGLRLLHAPDDWLPTLPERYRRRRVELMTLAECRKVPGDHFIKPPGDKSFPAAVYDAQTLPVLDDDTQPVLVAEIVHWAMEYRCFVLDRRVETWSVYLRDGDLPEEGGYGATAAEATAVIGFMDALLADPSVVLPRACVVDIGYIADRGWACVEPNGAWGAGLYGCDPVKALGVIRHASERR
ncbi:ATP-grasp domain-containing protein [Tahibacter amnicola]|uniref:ATP-grasp domain-containing protein n=1 Tax=Tahibacter amnicola TaxID=2976241 RepID=A0ABY6BDM8_9GAMM|nr:ATP-grasp domain-containing protein [Tahibacter amnicola]UXI68136.1 ATP-grasp domain-containing protein [Tahibacter amnicola]